MHKPDKQKFRAWLAVHTGKGKGDPWRSLGIRFRYERGEQIKDGNRVIGYTGITRFNKDGEPVNGYVATFATWFPLPADAGGPVLVSNAMCSPSDQFNKARGRALAAGRMMHTIFDVQENGLVLEAGLNLSDDVSHNIVGSEGSEIIEIAIPRPHVYVLDALEGDWTGQVLALDDRQNQQMQDIERQIDEAMEALS